MDPKTATFIILLCAGWTTPLPQCVPSGSPVTVLGLSFGQHTSGNPEGSSLQDYWEAEPERPFRRFPQTKKIEFEEADGTVITLLVTKMSAAVATEFHYHPEKSFDKFTFSNRFLFCEVNDSNDVFIAHLKLEVEHVCQRRGVRSPGQVESTSDAGRLDLPRLYDQTSQLRSGAFGVVKRATVSLDAVQVSMAIKRIPLDRFIPSEVHYLRKMADMKFGPGAFYGCQYDDRNVFIGSQWFAKQLADHSAVQRAKKTRRSSFGISLYLKLIDLLAELEERGVSHGDIKPGNIMLDDGYNPRLIDWDAAKPLGNPESTRGTAALMHPRRNSPTQPAIPQFDWYSMAWVMAIVESDEGEAVLTHYVDPDGRDRAINPEFYKFPNRTPSQWKVIFEMVSRVFEKYGGKYDQLRPGQPPNVAAVVVGLMDLNSGMTLQKARMSLLASRHLSGSLPSSPSTSPNTSWLSSGGLI